MRGRKFVYTPRMPRPIILDCDPGHDDAVALLLALGSPELDVLGVTVTHGNVELRHTLRNALALREFSGRDFPVVPGADRPLLRPPVHAGHVHGPSGLGDVTLPQPSRAAHPDRAANFIANEAAARPGELTLVAVGPLTNVALALRLAPELATTLREIVLMGGSADEGNVTPAAEFNTYADPHAARIVFESGASITMFGLDTTRQVPVTAERTRDLRGRGGRAGALAADFLDDYLTRLVRREPAREGALHDPCAAAYLVRPELFGVRPTAVEVVTDEGDAFGRTVCTPDPTSSTRVAFRADADGLYDLLAERLARL